MRQPAIELQGQAPKERIESPTGFVLTGPTKMGLLVLLFGLLYLRLWQRRRKKDRICAHCGHRNPPHRANCTNCSAPLFGG